MSDQRLISDRFPRTSRHHPDWVLAAVSGFCAASAGGLA